MEREIDPTRPWRVGRKLGRTLYVQRGDDPDDGDDFVGTMDTRELAEWVVGAVNGTSDDGPNAREEATGG